MEYDSKRPRSTEVHTTFGDLADAFFQDPILPYDINNGHFKHGPWPGSEFVGQMYIGKGGMMYGATYETQLAEDVSESMSASEWKNILGRAFVQDDVRKITFIKSGGFTLHRLEKVGGDRGEIEGKYEGHWYSDQMNDNPSWPLEKRETAFELIDVMSRIPEPEIKPI